jgi:nitrogenase molybdenum-iron protein alpha chain
LFHQSQLFLGYTGIYEFARRLARILRNPSFNRNLKDNVHLPYFEEWYDKDAFSYIDESELQA